MALVDTYRSNVANKTRELMRLREERAKEFKKRAENNKKIQNANDSLRKTKSESLAKSKISEITRYEKQGSDILKKISDIESKIARKEKELLAEQEKLNKEEVKIEKKRVETALKLEKERNKELLNISRTLQDHKDKYEDVSKRVEKLSMLPDEIAVLFLAMSPRDQMQLSLDEEARSISEMIRKTKHRDSVKFITCWAVRPLDVLQAINENNPTIIHFSGHGSEDYIAFQDDFGITKPVSTEALVQTMMASSDSIRLVFFNTCYSSSQAKAVVQNVEAAIGMNQSIGDEAARVFASQFYSAIGFGLSLETAFQQAKAALMLQGIEEDNTPELFISNEINSNEMIIVKPQ